LQHARAPGWQPAANRIEEQLAVRRWAVITASAAAVALVCSPLLWPTDRDSFPLSTYPMFAHDRPRVLELTTAVGVGPDGDAEFLSPELLAGTREPVQASVTVTDDVRAGRADALCAEIAQRLWRRGSALTRVDVITSRYDAVAWFGGDKEPLAHTVHATCPVGDAMPR
jgi:hypothetical protein